MQIDITGYITETYRVTTPGKARFTIKIMNDNVEDEKGNHPGVSKEKTVLIPATLYPSDYHGHFENVKDREDSEHVMEKIGECRSRCKELRKGDQVECAVFIVEEEVRNEIYNINRNPNNIETYTKFDLWLYPDPQLFKRLDVDSRESLKFRKQWRYTCINREEYKKITGSTLYGYRDKKWVNKNPKMIFPVLWWIQAKTTVSNLWKRFKRQGKNKSTTINSNKSTTINTIVTIIAIIVGIISIILFFKQL